MEREVSLPFTSPSPAPARRAIERAEGSALRLEVASVLEQRADDIAARWWEGARSLLPVATISTGEGLLASPGEAHPVSGADLVRDLAAAIARDSAGRSVGYGASDGDSPGATTNGLALGTMAFASGAVLHDLLGAVDQLAATCLDVVEDVVSGGEARAEPADAVRVCRGLLGAAETLRLTVTRGFIEAADRALHERFRRLRHDLRNPIGTIRSALSLMADETVPEEARRSPRFYAMIERNATALDQLISARLGDAEAKLLPAAGPRTSEPSAASLVPGEPRDDLTRARQRDDREAGSF